MRIQNVCDICSFNDNKCEQNHYVCDAVSDAYQKGKADGVVEFVEQLIRNRFPLPCSDNRLVFITKGALIDDVAKYIEEQK